MFLRTAPAVLGVPCRLGGEAACQCAKLPIALSDSCSVALPAAKRRLGALLSCVGFGWYEGRAMRQKKGERVWGQAGGECGWECCLGAEVAWWRTYVQVDDGEEVGMGCGRPR
jgi:hypothetical protein